jgi:hypothetical protein
MGAISPYVCMKWMYVFLAKSKSPLKREKCFPKKTKHTQTRDTDTQTPPPPHTHTT